MNRLTCIPALTLLVAASPALAQHGIGEREGVARKAEKPEVVKLSGMIEEVRIHPCNQTTGRSELGVHWMIKSGGGETYNLHLGPAGEVDDALGLARVGDTVDARAFRTEPMIERHFAAVSIQVGDKSIELRDETLRPRWAGRPRDGWRRGRRTTVETPAVTAETVVRIGVYDSRAIAVAWTRSSHNTVAEKASALREAEKAGDEAKMRELRKWGEMQQRKLHFQGFGKYPVDDLLEPIREGMADLMTARDLDAIVWMCHTSAEGVERIDVTVDLMKLLGMSEADAKKMADDLRKHEPVDFATLLEMSPEQ